MKNAFIIHGAYGKPEENWIPFVRDGLQESDYIVHAPQFPTPEEQNYDNWLSVITPHLDKFTEETVLVGHSIGATFALCILEKLEVTIAKTVLVSGFLGNLNNEQFDSINHTIAERDFAWSLIQANSRQFFVVHGDNDPYVPTEKASELSQHLSVPPIMIPNGGHLNADAGFTEFPLLLDLLKD